MKADDVARRFASSQMSPKAFDAAMSAIPGSSTHRWQKLYTEWENSSWSEAEFRRRVTEMLASPDTP